MKGHLPGEKKLIVMVFAKILSAVSNLSQFLRLSVALNAGQLSLLVVINFISLDGKCPCMKQTTIQMLSIKANTLEEGSLLALI